MHKRGKEKGSEHDRQEIPSSLRVLAEQPMQATLQMPRNLEESSSRSTQ